jgi:ubiquinone/menaquinone biosynthesis C-methylase UbiE
MNPSPTRFVVPAAVATHFHIRKGDTIADFGAGSGYFTAELSKRVGPSGRVYACEIQKPLVEKIGALALSESLHNVHPLWCDLEEDNGIKIETATIDIGVLVNTLFALEDKETAVREMSRTLRTGGKLCVVDWTESFGGLGPTPDLVVTKDDVTNMLESSGFVLESDYPAGDHHYGLLFRKL